MPKLYSYIRWSSDRQNQGTTKMRQLAAARAYAEEHKLEMVEIIEPGVSAFRGKNRDGKLGDFIDAVKSTAIPSDSWLYCENLDRLSRDDVDEALRLFLEIIGLGLTIVTGMDKKVYNKASIRNNPTDLMISILMFIRGNEESETKSSRTIGNVTTLVKRHLDGLPVNIKSVGKHPFWIDDSGSQYEAVRPHSQYWNIAREAIDLFLEGQGMYSVKRHLDSKYPNGLNGREWDYQVLKRMRENRALIGERTIKVNGQPPFKLNNYYPWLCKDEAEFIKLQEMRKQNKYQSKKTDELDTIKLLSGLSLLRCKKCGGTMHSFMNHGLPRYICTNGSHLQKKCNGWSITAPLVDHCTMIALMIGYMDKNRRDGSDTTDIENSIQIKQAAVSVLDTRINNIVTTISLAPSVTELAIQLNSLNEERNALILEVQRLQERKELLSGKGSFEVNIVEFMELIHWNVFNDMKDAKRQKIRSIISSIVEYVIVDKTDACISIKIKCFGSDEVLIFAGAGIKPHWIFDVEFVNDALEDDNVTLHPTVTKDERFSMASERLHKIRELYKSLYDTATGMLTIAGYPELEGKLFWPNK